MRKIIIAASILLCGIVAQAYDEIRWLNKVYDFGAFSEDDHKVKGSFKFVNETKEPVSIISAAATCGCTIPDYKKDAIAPGDTATIDVLYNPVGRPGRFEKYVYVRTSASPDRYKLAIKGAVIGNPATVKARYPVDMGPLKLRNGAAMLGRVPAGSSKSESVEAYNSSVDSLKLTFSGLPEYLDVLSSPEVIPPGEIGAISFFFSGIKCKEWGIVNDSITITTNGQEQFTMPIVAIVEEDFSDLTPEQIANAPIIALSSDRIELPDVPMESTTPVQGSVNITNRGKSPLIIHRIYSQDKAVSWELSVNEIAPGDSSTLTVTYDPTSVDTKIIDTRLTIITNDPGASTSTLRIVALR